MAIIKVDGYHGEAEIQGVLREISFHGDCLTIAGLTLAEGHDLLAVLATNSLYGKQPRGVKTAAMDVVLSACACDSSSKDENPPEEKDTPEPEAEPQAEQPQPRPQAGKKKEEAKPARVRAAKKKDEAKSEPEESTETKPETRDWVSGDGEPADKVAGVSDELMEELVTKTSLREVVSTLAENGFETLKELCEVCNNLKDNISVLKAAMDKDTWNKRIERLASSVGIEA